MPNLGKLRRNITQLKGSTSSSAQRLLGLLEFELRAIGAAARNQPATLALSRVTRKIPPPATIVVVSQLNHDGEALQVTLDKLVRSRYTVLHVGAPKLDW